MTQEQWMNLLRQMLPLLGGIATAQGWLTQAEASTLITSLLAWIGPMAILGGAVWGILDHRKVALIQKVDAIPEVAGVITKSTTAGLDLADDIPSPTVVAAGTIAAGKVAISTEEKKDGL